MASPYTYVKSAADELALYNAAVVEPLSRTIKGETVAFGRNSGQGTGTNAISIGSSSGVGCNTNSIAIGSNAGFNQGANAIAIGTSAGGTTASADSIAIGSNARANSTNSIVIGKDNNSASFANAIVIVADGTGATAAASNSCVIAPIRQKNSQLTSGVLIQDLNNYEIVSSTALKLNVAGKITHEFTGDAGIPCEFIRNSALTTALTMISFNRLLVEVGSITASSTATAYNTASDYRLKDVQGPIADASELLSSLKPISFAWKSTGEVVHGFLAHEVQEVVPEAVVGVKDAIDSNGTPVYQAIDQSKLVPLLVAALQDALKRIEVLELAAE